MRICCSRRRKESEIIAGVRVKKVAIGSLGSLNRSSRSCLHSSHCHLSGRHDLPSHRESTSKHPSYGLTDFPELEQKGNQPGTKCGT
ncbi:unnamed protein product [Allacma fusca]|uniref:Uncharacterized protein n=1 Tax=Allacma fusca TaxID=39272 RepID=A0A8J2JNF0_9HEXA|nr:unnamed protein product [Allacma fusca]